MLLEQSATEGVDRGDARLSEAVEGVQDPLTLGRALGRRAEGALELHTEAMAHLARRFLGECDHQQAVDGRSRGSEYPHRQPHDGVGLARAGRRLDHPVAGEVDALDGGDGAHRRHPSLTLLHERRQDGPEAAPEHGEGIVRHEAQEIPEQPHPLGHPPSGLIRPLVLLDHSQDQVAVAGHIPTAHHRGPGIVVVRDGSEGQKLEAGGIQEVPAQVA